jgi:hypothetical protein
VTEQPVIDLDDSFENRNWLRIVGLMRQGKTREEAIAEIKGASGAPGPIAGHDVAQHGNEGLSNPIEAYHKMFDKGSDGSSACASMTAPSPRRSRAKVGGSGVTTIGVNPSASR